MATLQPNDAAPDFTLMDQNQNEISLSSFKGRKVLIYFYPKADTPGCTRQSCSIRDSKSELTDRGIVYLGISPDQPDKQLKFDTKYELGFPLLSDPEHETAEAYGAWGEKKNYGKTYMGIIRSSFLINEEGKIIKAWYKVKPEDTVPKALEAAG
jgi:peroxiredoxin Q/BCP